VLHHSFLTSKIEIELERRERKLCEKQEKTREEEKSEHLGFKEETKSNQGKKRERSKKKKKEEEGSLTSHSQALDQASSKVNHPKDYIFPS
jgi:hypothetical protein